MRFYYMKINDRDIQILQHILNYCIEVEVTIKTFGEDENKFLNDFIYRNAISMPILQIGELVNHLSKDFTNLYVEMSWRDIVGMRNHFAHGYQVVDFSEVWETAIKDIPELKDFCESVLKENDIDVTELENNF